MKLLKELNDFTYDFTEVEKSKTEGKPLVVTGVIQRANKLNQNGRVYPRHILEPKIEAYKELVRERRATGELDHADEPVVNLKNVSHVITDIWMDDEGTVFGKVEILENLPMGKILKGLFESNIKVGISSRALGSVETSSNGDIVQDDLHFICWDFVSEPSTPGAWMMKESKEYSAEEARRIISRQQKVELAINELFDFHNKIKNG